MHEAGTCAQPRARTLVSVSAPHWPARVLGAWVAFFLRPGHHASREGTVRLGMPFLPGVRGWGE